VDAGLCRTHELSRRRRTEPVVSITHACTTHNTYTTGVVTASLISRSLKSARDFFPLHHKPAPQNLELSVPDGGRVSWAPLLLPNVSIVPFRELVVQKLISQALSRHPMDILRTSIYSCQIHLMPVPEISSQNIVNFTADGEGMWLSTMTRLNPWSRFISLKVQDTEINEWVRAAARSMMPNFLTHFTAVAL